MEAQTSCKMVNSCVLCQTSPDERCRIGDTDCPFLGISGPFSTSLALSHPVESERLSLVSLAKQQS